MADIKVLFDNKKVVKSADDLKLIRTLTDAISNNGLYTDDYKSEDKATVRQLGFKDIMTTKEFYQLMPEVVENILMDTIPYEPLISNLLFQEVPVPRATTYTFSQMGPFEAAEIAEGQEYPEQKWDRYETGFRLEVPIKKYGMRIKVTDEVIENDLFGIWGLWLRKAKEALVQRREVTCHDAIQGLGEVVFDNANPSASLYGSLRGRDITGAANGTMTMEDILDQHARLTELGFTPDIMFIHPYAWKMWAIDPEMRESMLYGGMMSSQHLPQGNASNYWNQLNNPYLLRWNATGNPTLQNPYTDPQTGLIMKLGPNPWTQQLGMMGYEYTLKPGFLPSGIRIVVSPFVRLQKVGSVYVTDIIMADSSEVGVVLRHAMPKTEEWRDPNIDARNLKIMERYGVALLNQGKAINIAKNVVVDRNYVFKEHVVNVTSFAAIDQTVAKV